MSFSISLSGHSSEPHNAAVANAFRDAVRALRAVPGMSITGSGSTSDATGSITLTTDAVDAPDATAPAADAAGDPADPSVAGADSPDALPFADDPAGTAAEADPAAE